MVKRRPVPKSARPYSSGVLYHPSQSERYPRSVLVVNGIHYEIDNVKYKYTDTNKQPAPQRLEQTTGMLMGRWEGKR